MGEIVALTYLFMNSSVILVKPRRSISLCRDPEDDKFLEVAYEARVDYIITLDTDLLDMRDEDTKEVDINSYKVRILRPEEFLQEIKA